MYVGRKDERYEQIVAAPASSAIPAGAISSSTSVVLTRSLLQDEPSDEVHDASDYDCVQRNVQDTDDDAGYEPDNPRPHRQCDNGD